MQRNEFTQNSDMPIQWNIQSKPRTRDEFLDKAKYVDSRVWYWRIRRTQDILLSVLALIVLMPVMLLIALVIWIDDPKGSPIFAQTRIGKDGKAFKLYKFRSMYVDAEKRLDELLKFNEMDGPAFKIKDDPRITRIGHIIRRSSIDELPQLINIIRGEMSIVGPRPAILREVEQYDEYQRQRLLITPGLTCFWQIQPNRNSVSFDDWVELDLKYIRERSFIVDWKIILGTLKAVLNMEGV